MNDYNERTIRPRLRAMLSINDPRWGRGGANGEGQRSNESRRPQNGKNGDGPPDLDEMWRDFNRRLNRLLGRKGGGGGPRPDNGRGARIGVGIVIGVLIAIYLGSGLFVVQQGRAGVVLQFGQYFETVEPGVHWRLPYPIQSQEIVDLSQIHSVEVGHNSVVPNSAVRDASMLTHDGDIVELHFTVQYQIRKPVDYLFRSADPDQSVMQAAQSAARAIVGGLSTDAVLDQDREAMREQLVSAIQTSLDGGHTGLVVTGVTVQDASVPQSVRAAFDDATRARQDRERARRQAEAYTSELLPRVQADAARMIDDAKSYSERVVTEAQGDAQRFDQVYAQYSKAPAVIRERMYLDTMQHIYANTTKVFVDSKSSNNVLYLPLDKLVEQTRARAAAAAAAGANAAAGQDAAQQAAGPAPDAAGANGINGANAGNSAASGASAPPSDAAASDTSAASDVLRSREAFRSRVREDDLQ